MAMLPPMPIASVAIAIAVNAGAEGPMAESSRKRIEAELEVLRSSGSTVFLIGPDDASRKAFGLNLMDFTRRAGAAEAGLAQGRNEALKLQGSW